MTFVTWRPVLSYSRLRGYVGKVAPPPTVDVIRPKLWAPDVASDDWRAPGLSAVLIEQYKMYAEMADRLSARRGTTNAFFLTLNSAIFTAIGFLWTARPHGQTWLLCFPTAALVAQCLAWYWLVRSYRQLNSAKYAVIGALEERLPASPYWRGEWIALGEGKDPARYLPLTHLEQWIPVLFAAIYVGGFAALLAVSP